MGGVIAFEIMRQAPERVARLALRDIRATADTPEQSAGRTALTARVERGGFADVADALLFRYLHPERRHDALPTKLGRQMRAPGRRRAARRP